MSDWFLDAALLPRQTWRGLAYYQRGRRGAPVLLIHGVGLNGDCWRAQAAALARKHRVFVPDLPGHGGSRPLPKRAPQIEDFANKMAEFARAKMPAAPVVVGHSLGALVALALAAGGAPRPRAVAALAAVYKRGAQAKRAVEARAKQLRQPTARRALVGQTVARWFGERPPAAQRAAAECCRRWLAGASPAGYARAYQMFAASDAAALPLERVCMPALFLAGGKDKNSTAAMAKQLAARLPQGRARALARHGHLLQMTAAEEVSDILARWLGGAQAAAAAK